MDVLKPPLIYVDGRCYRINNPDFNCSQGRARGVEWDDTPSSYERYDTASVKSLRLLLKNPHFSLCDTSGNLNGIPTYMQFFSKKTYLVDTECTLDEPCDEVDDDSGIIQLDSGRYKTAFHVARVYFATIIGTKGQTKKRVEVETKTIIRVPRQPQDQDVLITGGSIKAVASARRKIKLIVYSYRRKQQATHFLSIRMFTPTVKENFINFKDQVLQNCRCRGVDESIFQSPEKLHLTLCTLVINDSVERAQATRVLESCKKDVIDPLMEGNTITILLKGLDYMNDDPSEVNVLYARIIANEILQQLVNNIVDYCSQADLLDKDFESVKLHVTLLNTIFRNTGPKDNNHGKSSRETKETFNARPILEKFHDFEFGEVTIDTVHLSTRFTTSETDGYYQSTAKIYF